MPHLELHDIEYWLPDGRPLLGGVSFRVGDGHRTALVGPNGTGKTTLMRILSGEITDVEGQVTCGPWVVRPRTSWLPRPPANPPGR